MLYKIVYGLVAIYFPTHIQRQVRMTQTMHPMYFIQIQTTSKYCKLFFFWCTQLHIILVRGCCRMNRSVFLFCLIWGRNLAPFPMPIRAVTGQRSWPELGFANKTKMFSRAKNKDEIKGPLNMGHFDLNLFWGQRLYYTDSFSKSMTFIHQILFNI